jgi:hypothetical protein
MNNIELTLSKVEEELKCGNTKMSKTLMDIYKNLFYQFNRDGWNSDHEKFKQNLLNHRNKLEELHKFTDNELKISLENKEFGYKKAHDITMIVQRIEVSINMIKETLNQLNNYKKLPQYKTNTK